VAYEPLQHLGPLPTVTHAESEHAGGTMRALAWFGSKDVRIVDAPIPAVTEPDDVIIRVTASTICGSDLHLWVSSNHPRNQELTNRKVSR
jgi:hypothetical protein